MFRLGSAVVWVSVAAVVVTVLLTPIPSQQRTSSERSLFSQSQVPPKVATALRAACFDCHSNETEWPWYAHLPISSALLVHDVKRARQHLNFSDWQTLKEKGPEELAAGYSGVCENLLSGAMPKRYYLWLHPTARLSKDQVSDICSWTDKEQMQALRQTAAK